jgi:hypothetical protein
MTQSFDDAGKIGREFIDSSLRSFASVTKAMQAIAVETTDYTKKSFESGSAALEKLASAKTLDKAIEVQTEYAKNAYESFVSEATKMGELYADLFKDCFKPFEAWSRPGR